MIKTSYLAKKSQNQKNTIQALLYRKAVLLHLGKKIIMIIIITLLIKFWKQPSKFPSSPTAWSLELQMIPCNLQDSAVRQSSEFTVCLLSTSYFRKVSWKVTRLQKSQDFRMKYWAFPSCIPAHFLAKARDNTGNFLLTLLYFYSKLGTFLVNWSGQ